MSLFILCVLVGYFGSQALTRFIQYKDSSFYWLITFCLFLAIALRDAKAYESEPWKKPSDPSNLPYVEVVPVERKFFLDPAIDEASIQINKGSTRSLGLLFSEHFERKRVGSLRMTFQASVGVLSMKNLRFFVRPETEAHLCQQACIGWGYLTAGFWYYNETGFEFKTGFYHGSGHIFDDKPRDEKLKTSPDIFPSWNDFIVYLGYRRRI